jgi:metabolite-proton symporter
MTASLVGTAIEFYDFYIFGTAAALALGQIFFPSRSPNAQMLAAFATFGIAFLARPIGSALFGHFGDRYGRKSTLVSSLLLMGISTTLIGALPGYAAVGLWAPVTLCLLRLAQGVGLGGEWGGAALLAVENAPAGRRAWFGMFPQLGPPLGFLLANGLFILLFKFLTSAQFAAWGWRIPFLLSAILVALGLYARIQLSETPAFAQLAARGALARVPLGDLLRDHARHLVLGSLAMVVCYAIFYVSTVFALSYGTHTAHIPRETFLGLLCIAISVMAIATPVSAHLSDRFGCRPVLLVCSALAALSAFTMQPLLGGGGTAGALVFLSLQLGLMGLLFAPMGAFLPSLFPAAVRYTGASATYNLGGILGASFAPYIAQILLIHGGLAAVSFYISGAAIISFLAILQLPQPSEA